MTPDEYQAKQILAVSNELTELQLQYDTRLLATAMLDRAVFLLRCLVATGKWTPHDIQAVATEALADLHVPLETKPRQMVRDPNDLSS